MINIENITKYYGEKKVLENINIKISPGSIFGLLGKNGAGKTTLINLMAGVLKPTDGKILINNIDVNQSPIEVKKHIGVLPEVQMLYEYLSPVEHMRFVCEIFNVDSQKRESKISEILELIDLQEFAGTPAKKCSKGTRQKIMLSMVLIHDPGIIFLDEPTSGLDIPTANSVKNIIKKLRRQDKIIILTTHIAEIAEQLCDTVAILHNHSIVECCGVEELKGKYKENNLESAFIKIVS